MLHLFSTSDFRLLLLPVPSRLCVHKLSFLRRRTVSVTTPPLLAAPPEPSRLRARTSSRFCGGVARCPSPPHRRVLLPPSPLGCVRAQALVVAAASHGVRRRPAVACFSSRALSAACAHKLSFLRRHRTVSVATPPSLAAPPEPSRLRALTSSRCCGGVARCPPRRRLLLPPSPLGCVRSQALDVAAASHGPSPTAPPSLAAPPEPSRLRALTSSCFRGDVARCPCWLRACVRFFSSGGIARCVSPPRHRLLPPL